MKIVQTLALLGVVTALGCCCLAAQSRSGGKRFTLRGTVVDGLHDSPLADVEVSLQTENWKPSGEPAISDSQGRFAFHDLAAGEYILSAEGRAFGLVRYGEAPDPGWVSTVRVGGEDGDKSVVFRIVPRGSIEGAVHDEFGEPMMGVSVMLSRPLWRDGGMTMAMVAGKSSDDRGRYRIGNLAPGTYIVCVAGNQNSPAPLPGPVDFAARVDNRFYTRTCNRQFQLSPGQRAQVDLTPTTASTATVRGHLRNLPPQTGYSVSLQSEDANVNQTFGAYVDVSQGTFAVRGVPPGRYRLRAQTYSTVGPGTTQKAPAAEVPVDVGGSDVDGVDVSLDSEGTVDVAFHGVTENGLDATTVSASLRSAGAAGDFAGGMRGEKGEFHFGSLAPARYRVIVHTPAESCVESVKLGDSDVRLAPFQLAAAAALHIDVTVSKNCGAIELRAVRDDAPVPDAKVVLLVSGTPRDPGELKEDFVDDEGAYSFSGLAPGRYLLWSWAVSGKGAIVGPASLAAVEQQATVVEVKAGEPVHVDVPLLTDEGKGQ